MAKTLVTCATGNISSQVVAALREKGVDTRAGVLDASKAQHLSKFGAEVVNCDLNSTSSVEKALEGVDKLFLLSPFEEDLVSGVNRTVAAAKAAKVKLIVRSSGMGADPNSQLPVAAQHGKCEGIVKESGIPWIILQPTFFQDNFLNFHKHTILGQGTFYGASGSGKTAYVSTRDIAYVAATLLVSPNNYTGKTLAVTGPEAISDEEAAAILSKALGKPVKYTNLTGEQYRQGALQQGVPEWLANNLTGLEYVKSQGWAAAVAPTVKEVLQRPAESFKAYVERNLDRFRS